MAHNWDVEVGQVLNCLELSYQVSCVRSPEQNFHPENVCFFDKNNILTSFCYEISEKNIWSWNVSNYHILPRFIELVKLILLLCNSLDPVNHFCYHVKNTREYFSQKRNVNWRSIEHQLRIRPSSHFVSILEDFIFFRERV